MSYYENCKIVLTTKHKKEQSISPAFAIELMAEIVTCELDTDILGTFSGEVPRKSTALESARTKCEWGLDTTNLSYGLASEGSFGPHPAMHFVPCNQEILYFIDKKLDLHIYEKSFSLKTNYQTKVIASVDELMQFASNARFPSHALIVRPNLKASNLSVFKGIVSEPVLIDAFEKSIACSADKKVWVETDMRAHMNPSRMAVIHELSLKLARRLKSICKICNAPGWGITSVVKGLECRECGMGTEMVKFEIFTCTKCSAQEMHPSNDALLMADPGNCWNCNP